MNKLLMQLFLFGLIGGCVANHATLTFEELQRENADLRRELLEAREQLRAQQGPTKDSQAVPMRSIVEDVATGSCTNTPGFTNGYGQGCASYEEKWCANGKARPSKEWTLGAKYNFPERHCCVCGKECPSFMWGTNASDTFGGGLASDRCQGRCDLVPTLVNRECMVSEFRMTTIKQCVERDAAAPAGTLRWKIYRHSDWQARNAKWPGSVKYDEVTCPCNNAPGKALTEFEALRRILGQTAAMKPFHYQGIAPDARAALAPMFTMKVSFAAFLMLRCWRAKCSAQSTSTDLLQTIVNAEVQLDLHLGAGFGGGSYC